MSPKLLAVIQREYLQQVRGKAFWVATLLIPTLGALFILLNVTLSRSVVSAGRIAVVDLTGKLAFRLEAERARKPAGGSESRLAGIQLEAVEPPSRPEDLKALRSRLNQDVQDRRLKAYLVLDERTLQSGLAEWRGASVRADLVLRTQIARLLSRAITKQRLSERGIDPSIWDETAVSAELEVREASDRGDEARDSVATLAVSGILFMLIYMSLFIYGMQVMRGVLEEKNSRIVEVIVSSVRPTQLMLGKILGIGLAGLTQFSIWALTAGILTAPTVLLSMGVSQGLPPIPPTTLVALVVFFLLGYFFYASLYAAVAAPCNTEQEAQQLVMLPMSALMITFSSWFVVYNNPGGGLATFFSFFPLSASLAMFMRISVQGAPGWQIAVSIVVQLAAIWLMAWLAGRIYRVGILMYGKRPTIPEILRWVARAD